MTDGQTDGQTDGRTDAHVKCYVSTTIVGRQKIVKHPQKKLINYKLHIQVKIVKENGKLADMMKGVIIKCQSNEVSHFQITGTYKNLNQKLQPENSTENTKIL